ncbi:hypothetical protein ACFE04_023625 [Oxalis oulophora]
MATTLLSSPIPTLKSSSIFNNNNNNNKILFLSSNKNKHRFQRCFAEKSLDHIPKQFRQENLKDGLMDNYKNIPSHLYGLSPSQIEMFMTKDNPFQRQSQCVTEESISSAKNYLDESGIYDLATMSGRATAKYTMSAGSTMGMYDGEDEEAAPPDLPSLLLDSRIIYLGMPIVAEVTELIIAEFMWLDFDDSTKPIYLYINSSGTQDEKMESVGSETDAYAIADTMAYCKSEVHTVNSGMAFGQAAMLLGLGAKGNRAVQPNSSTKLYLPKVGRSSGAVIDMWIKAKEVNATSDTFIELISKATGRSKEEIGKDIQRPKFLSAQEAVDYGLADKVISKGDKAAEAKNYDQLLAQSIAMERGGGGFGPARPAPSGFR